MKVTARHGDDLRLSAEPAPLTASAVYGGDSDAIGEARRFVRDFLSGPVAWYGAEVSAATLGAAQLVVSELVTNVCKHAPGPCVLDLKISGDCLTIELWDGDPALPTVLAADPGRVGRHGMEIVQALCQGLEMHREPVGKRIKAHLRLGESAE